MTRFVDSNATRTIPVGPCDCPGTPHEADEAVIRERLGYGSLLHIGSAPTEEEAKVLLLMQALVSWNFLGADGKPVPVARESIEALEAATARTISEAVDDVVSEMSAALPNASGAASAATSAGSASPIPVNRRTRRSTKHSSSSAPAGVSAS